MSCFQVCITTNAELNCKSKQNCVTNPMPKPITANCRFASLRGTKQSRDEVLFQCLSDGLCQLVRTGSAFEAATDAFQFRDNVFSFHAFHEGGDALRIAVAAAVELHIFQDAVHDFKLDGLTAGALGSVGIFH